MRDLERACRLAHSEPPWRKDQPFRPYKCPQPGCGKELLTREALEAEAAEVASWGPEKSDLSRKMRGKHRVRLCNTQMIVLSIASKLQYKTPN